jgi:hypothetical protein
VRSNNTENDLHEGPHETIGRFPTIMKETVAPISGSLVNLHERRIPGWTSQKWSAGPREIRKDVLVSGSWMVTEMPSVASMTPASRMLVVIVLPPESSTPKGATCQEPLTTPDFAR